MHTKKIVAGGIECECCYEYYPPSKGTREKGTGFQLEPDCDAEIELYEICIGEQDVTDIVTDRFRALCEEELQTSIYQDMIDDKAAEADFRYDEWKERQYES